MRGRWEDESEEQDGMGQDGTRRDSQSLMENSYFIYVGVWCGVLMSRETCLEYLEGFDHLKPPVKNKNNLLQ